MAYEQRDNSGIISKNEKKNSEKHPDYKGNALVDGQEYWISAWIKDGRNGKFLSLAFEPKESQGGGNRSSSSKKGASSDDDMPF